MNIINPTYGQLVEGSKKHLKVTYKYTVEKTLELSMNGVHDMIFANNELGQAQIIAENGELAEGISSVVINQNNQIQ